MELWNEGDPMRSDMLFFAFWDGFGGSRLLEDVRRAHRGVGTRPQERVEETKPASLKFVGQG